MHDCNDLSGGKGISTMNQHTNNTPIVGELSGSCLSILFIYVHNNAGQKLHNANKLRRKQPKPIKQVL